MTHHPDQDGRRLSARAFTAIIAALVLAFAVAACGDDEESGSSSSSGTTTSSSSGSSSSNGSADSGSDGVAEAKSRLAEYESAPTEITIKEPLSGPVPEGKTLVMLGTNDPNNVKLQESLEELSKLAGWNYSTVDYDPANPATFKAAVNTALQKNPDYVAEAGIPLTPDVVKLVEDAGAKWALMAVHPVELDDTVIVAANAYANDEIMGKVLADWFISDSDGKGNAIIETVPAYPILTAFTDGFQAEVDELCPDCKVQLQEITIPDLAAGKIPSVMVSALRKNPDADYLGFDVGPFAGGIDAALASAGLTDKVKIMGEAADEAGIQALKAGKHAAWTGFDATYSTYVIMDAMFRDQLGDPLIDPAVSGVQPTQILTPDNIEDAVGDNPIWSQPEDTHQQFTELWGWAPRAVEHDPERISQEESMTPVLDVQNLSKTFTRTKALSNVSLAIEPGEVHALLGQNGSGKSTLIKVLSGYHAPDYGANIRIAGEQLPTQDPIGAYRLGCRFVQQDLGLVGDLSVIDNLSIGAGFPTRFGTIKRSATLEQARSDLARLKLDLDPRVLVDTLSAAERTGVAVARALREDPLYPAKLLVLDEPTATLPVDEVDRLLQMVEHMAASGVGILYVTHHLGEVFRVANQVSVFRDGVVVGSGPVANFDHNKLVHLLAGEELLKVESESRKARALRAAERGKQTVLEIDDLRSGALNGLSFKVDAGEIVGIAGLTGSGRDNVLGAAFGSLTRDGGEVTVAGEALPAKRPDIAIGKGVAYLAPDRKTGGSIMTMSARENLTLPSLKPFWKGGILRRRAERSRTQEWFKRLSVRPAGAEDEPLSIFSGGNQQKVLFGKWLSQAPSVFLLDEPTQGVDVGAKADLHKELEGAAMEGAAVVLSSSDLEELADLCDRVLVIVEGKLSSELKGEDLTEARITRSFMPLAAEPVA